MRSWGKCCEIPAEADCLTMVGAVCWPRILIDQLVWHGTVAAEV